MGEAKVKEGPMRTVWIYVDTNYEAGHPDHLKVFLDPDSADEWFAENDPEGVVFGYDIEDSQAAVESENARSGAHHQGIA